MIKNIGRTGTVHFRGDCYVTVLITDAKTAYGALRFEVEPLAGLGRVWIDAASIEITPEAIVVTADRIKEIS